MEQKAERLERAESKLPFELAKRSHALRKGVTGDFGHLVTYPNFFTKFASEIPISELLARSYVIIDKPAGPTSHQVSAYVKDIVGAEITGHTGTLDPNVTGVLPVALSRSTKMIMGLINAGKEYVCYMFVHKALDEAQIRSVCQSFVGQITQLPPVKSAVKREERQRSIYYLNILEIDGQHVLFKVGCEAGTYIRKLCTDIGDKLGCGAHMQQLVRTKAGPFSTQHMVTLQDFQDAFIAYSQNGDETRLRSMLVPVEQSLSHLRKVFVFDTAAVRLVHGATLLVPGVLMCDQYISQKETVVVYDIHGKLVGIGEAQMDGGSILSESKGVCVVMKRIFATLSDYGIVQEPKVKSDAVEKPVRKFEKSSSDKHKSPLKGFAAYRQKAQRYKSKPRGNSRSRPRSKVN